MKNLMCKAKKTVQQGFRRGAAVLQSTSGNGEMTGMLILVLIVVVLGAILLYAFREQIDSMMDQVGSKIDEMFNYS